MAENTTNNKKGNSKKLLIAILLIVIIVVAVGVAAYILSQNPANPSDGGNPTATPSSSATPSGTSPTATPTEVNVGDASSLKYSVSLTENGVLQGSYTYQGKNAGTANFMIRIDASDSDGDTTFIFNGAQHKAWTYAGGEWTDISDFYDMQFQIWDGLWSAYTTNLSAWTGAGDYTYSDGTSTVRIYDIAVNPSLPDSLFEHT